MISEDLKVLYYDIETSLMPVYTFYIGNKVSINYDQIIDLPRILCVSYKWAGEKKVHNIKYDLKKRCDRKLIEEFNKIHNSADIAIAYNGDAFDDRYLRARTMVEDINIAFLDTLTIDPLKIFKRSFRLPNYKLDSIAKMLKLGHKNSMSIQDWIDIERVREDYGKALAALNKMCKYCDKDVLLLEKLVNRTFKHCKLAPGELSKLTMGKDSGPRPCESCGSKNLKKNGLYKYKGVAYQYRLCKDCYKPQRGEIIK